MSVYGPTGTVAPTENLTKAFAADIRIRIDEYLPPAEVAFAAKDIAAGVVYERNGVKVSAIDVDHGEKICPSFGYVIEFDGKKVVLSGDTRYDEWIAAAAKSADVLVHEVALIEPELSKTYPSYREVEATRRPRRPAGSSAAPRRSSRSIRTSSSRPCSRCRTFPKTRWLLEPGRRTRDPS